MTAMLPPRAWSDSLDCVRPGPRLFGFSAVSPIERWPLRRVPEATCHSRHETAGGSDPSPQQAYGEAPCRGAEVLRYSLSRPL